MGAATSQISYTASKGGVLSLSRELGVEFARARRPGQRALPGPRQHPAAQELFATDPADGAALVHLPMGRFAEARRSRRALSSWPSDEQLLVTASTFLVDGGLSGAYTTPLD